MAHRKQFGGTVLIVDDDLASRKALEAVLADEGYTVATAADGGAALAYLRSGHKPDVILLDLMMPVLDGWDFRTEQKRDPALADIPVVAISAAGKLVDGDYSLRKPIRLEMLLDILQKIVGAAI